MVSSIEILLYNHKGRSYFEEEDQYAILGFPANDYLGYVDTDTAEGKEIGKSVHGYLDNINFNFDALFSVGGDGCSTNTGPWGDAFHAIEKVFFCFMILFSTSHIKSQKILGRPLQWSVCQLHLNDNQLRRLFKGMEGNTKVTDKIPKGSIGKSITDKFLQSRNPVAFSKIEWPESLSGLDPSKLAELNNDQKTLILLSTAVHSGKLANSLYLCEVTNQIAPLYYYNLLHH